MLKGVKNITVIEMASRIGQDIGLSTRWVILKELSLRGVKIVTRAKMKDIKPGQVVYTNAEGNDVTLAG